MNGQTESNLLVRNCYSQHNSITINRSSVYYSESVDGSTINATKQAYMGAIYGRRAKGYVKDCYCVGDNANGYGITNTSAKVYVGIGTSSGSGSVANCRAVSNSVKNGEGTISFSSGTINANGISLANKIVSLEDLLNLGTYADSNQSSIASYTSSASAEPISFSLWEGKGTGVTTQAYLKTLNALSYYDNNDN